MDLEGEVEEEVGLEDEEEEAEVVRGASNVGSRGTFPENVPKVVEAGVEGEEEEEMDVSSVESKVTFQENALKLEGVAGVVEEEEAGADFRKT